MENIKTGNFATDWLIDRIGDSSTVKPGDRTATPGFWSGALGGALGLDTGLIATTKQKGVNNTAALDYLDSTGRTLESIGLKDTGGLTKSTINSAIVKTDKAEKKAEKKEDEATAAGIRQEGYKQSNNQLTAQLRSQENRLSHTDKQNRLDRSLERELAGNREDLNLQIAMMNNELSEKRMAYDRETRSMDRRDKMIAQLMSGIGQLGGAFAL